jgi:hypothetical protein
VGEEYSESVASHSNVSIKLLIDKSAIPINKPLI